MSKQSTLWRIAAGAFVTFLAVQVFALTFVTYGAAHAVGASVVREEHSNTGREHVVVVYKTSDGYGVSDAVTLQKDGGDFSIPLPAGATPVEIVHSHGSNHEPATLSDDDFWLSTSSGLPVTAVEPDEDEYTADTECTEYYYETLPRSVWECRCESNCDDGSGGSGGSDE